MSPTDDTSNWYVIHTHPRQENRANMNLRAWGITTLSPKIREQVYVSYSNKETYVLKPFFPRYIFAQFSITKLRKVQFTRGVYRVVCFGDGPTSVGEEIISEVKSRVGADGNIHIIEVLAPGDNIIMGNGPMAAFRGIFVCKVSANDRVRILLEAVSYQAHLEIERAALEKSTR